MKTIIASEAACEAIRDRLISELTKAMEKREELVKAGEMTGVAVSPGSTINYHVVSAFNALRDA